MELLKMVLLIAACVSSLVSTSAVGIIYFQHRLMWRAFARRKGLNGYERNTD